MENITVEMTQDDLLVIIGSLIKDSVSKGVHDQKILDLVARLSLQAIDKIDFEEHINK
jgi:hypothetical protein